MLWWRYLSFQFKNRSSSLNSKLQWDQNSLKKKSCPSSSWERETGGTAGPPKFPRALQQAGSPRTHTCTVRRPPLSDARWALHLDHGRGISDPATHLYDPHSCRVSFCLWRVRAKDSVSQLALSTWALQVQGQLQNLALENQHFIPPPL